MATVSLLSLALVVAPVASARSPVGGGAGARVPRAVALVAGVFLFLLSGRQPGLTVSVAVLVRTAGASAVGLRHSREVAGALPVPLLLLQGSIGSKEG